MVTKLVVGCGKRGGTYHFVKVFCWTLTHRCCSKVDIFVRFCSGLVAPCNTARPSAVSLLLRDGDQLLQYSLSISNDLASEPKSRSVKCLDRRRRAACSCSLSRQQQRFGGERRRGGGRRARSVGKGDECGWRRQFGSPGVCARYRSRKRRSKRGTAVAKLGVMSKLVDVKVE